MRPATLGIGIVSTSCSGSARLICAATIVEKQSSDSVDRETLGCFTEGSAPFLKQSRDSGRGQTGRLTFPFETAGCDSARLVNLSRLRHNAIVRIRKATPNATPKGPLPRGPT